MPASEYYKRFSRLPEGRPSWLGPWQLWPCSRCQVETDSGEHQCITDEDSNTDHKDEENVNAEYRPFSDLLDTGLLWLINTSILHPRGYAIALVIKDGEAVGWQLQGDGSESWVMEDKAHNDKFRRVNELLSPVVVAIMQSQLDSRGNWILEKVYETTEKFLKEEQD